VNPRARDRDPDSAPDREPPTPAAAIPEAVRRALDRVASWMQAELGLVLSGVRALTRDVRGMVADVKDVFATLSARLALIETRLSQMEEREPPAGSRERPGRCRRRARPRRPGRGHCGGSSPDH